MKLKRKKQAKKFNKYSMLKEKIIKKIKKDLCLLKKSWRINLPP
jgi:hypothetical protein